MWMYRQRIRHDNCAKFRCVTVVFYFGCGIESRHQAFARLSIARVKSEQQRPRHRRQVRPKWRLSDCDGSAAPFMSSCFTSANDKCPARLVVTNSIKEKHDGCQEAREESCKESCEESCKESRQEEEVVFQDRAESIPDEVKDSRSSQKEGTVRFGYHCFFRPEARSAPADASLRGFFSSHAQGAGRRCDRPGPQRVERSTGGRVDCAGVGAAVIRHATLATRSRASITA